MEWFRRKALTGNSHLTEFLDDHIHSDRNAPLKYLAQPANAFPDLFFHHARVSENKSWTRRPSQKVASYSVDTHATRRRVRDDTLFRGLSREPKHDMCSGAIAGQLGAFAQILVNGVQ
jgi:hypothetical protein